MLASLRTRLRARALTTLASRGIEVHRTGVSFEFIPGAPQFHDVVSWMHDHGFVVADLFDAHNRLLDGALARMDVAFVHEDGRFRQSHSYGTSEQLDALYASWGY